jgi:exopolyphosphatase/guanosine-5'-triphosphate,3'-diphosphate pyrophosphatase
LNESRKTAKSQVIETTDGAELRLAESGISQRAPQVVRKPPAATYGAIDIGTNSIHFLLVEITPEGDFRVLGSDKEMVRLGRGGFAENELTEESMEAGLAALRRFRQFAELKGVRKTRAVATSAVREAHNGGDFVKRVKDELELDVNVISVEEEGRLIYLGVRTAVDLGTNRSLIIDIGGGSAELIVGNRDELAMVRSAKLGGSRLAELFLHSDPYTREELQALRAHIGKQLTPLLQPLTGSVFSRCIGTSGTIRSLVTLCDRQRGESRDDPNAIQRLLRSDLEKLCETLAGKSRAERLRLPGMDARRVDSCLPAGAVLLDILRGLDIEMLEYCDTALREGVIVDYIGFNRQKLLARATWPDPRMRSVMQLAERLDPRREHSAQVARLALQLFDALAPLHRLAAQYRELLYYACLLHDVGYVVGHPAHHKHSYYLISNGRLKGFDEQEIEVIANVARYHRKDRPRKTHFSFQQLLPMHRPAVRRLALILRLADALDRTHYQIVDAVTCRISKDAVEFVVETERDAELELWTARRHAELFEREFDRQMRIRSANGALPSDASDGET